MNTREVDVVVVGAGITGLSVAWRLYEAGLSFVLLEKEGRLGGQIKTLHKNGYTCELGPNTSTISFPEVCELFDFIALYTTIQLANEQCKNRLIWKEGRYHPLPKGLFSGIRTPLFTLRDKIHLLGEPFYKRGTNPDESVGALAERRLGKSFVDYAVDPFIGGIYAGNPYALTTRFALPKLYALESKYGSFIRGAIKQSKKKKSIREARATKEVFSAVGGLEAIINGIENKIKNGGSILKSALVQSVQYTEDKNWEISYRIASSSHIETIRSSHYVTTVRGDQLKEVLPREIAKNLQYIESLQYAPVTEIAFGFDHFRGSEDRAFGLLVPSIEQRSVLGILFPSDCFSGRVPYADSRLFTVFMEGVRGNSKFRQLDEDLLIKVAQKELYQMLKIDPGSSPSFVHVSRYPKAIPQYGIDSQKRIDCIEYLQEKYKGLYLGGAIKDGVGLAHRIKQGSDIGLSIARRIKKN